MSLSQKLTSVPEPKKIVQVEHHDSEPCTKYRLQTCAYVNRKKAWPDTNSPLYLRNRRILDSAVTHSQSAVPSHGLVLKQRTDTDKRLNFKNENKLKSVPHLPKMITQASPDATLSLAPLSPQINLSMSPNKQKQLHSIQPLRSSSTSKLRDPVPIQKLRSQTARLSLTTSSSSIRASRKIKRRRFSFEDDPNRLAMKLSLPCTNGCCYCVYSSLVGPVRVYITRADKPKREPLLYGIKDGNGKAVIPVSRKSDIKGLVYDPVSCSLHPPLKSQKTVLHERRQLKGGSKLYQAKSHNKAITNIS